jgi:hypothetical protein
MATVLQIRDYHRAERQRPDRSAKVIRLPLALGARARLLREQFNKTKPITIEFK